MPTLTVYANSNTVVSGTFTGVANAYADDTSYVTSSPSRSSTNTIQYYFPAITTAQIPNGAVVTSAIIECNVWATNYSLSVVESKIFGQSQFDPNYNYPYYLVTNTSDLGTSPAQLDVTEVSSLSLLRSASNNPYLKWSLFRFATNTTITGTLDYVRLVVTYVVPSTVQTSFSINSVIASAVTVSSLFSVDAYKNKYFYINSRIPKYFKAEAFKKSYKAFSNSVFSSYSFQTLSSPKFVHKTTSANSIFKKNIVNSFAFESIQKEVFNKTFTANSIKSLILTRFNSLVKANISNSFEIQYEWTNSPPTRYVKFRINAVKAPPERTLYFYANRSFVNQPTSKRTFYFYANRAFEKVREYSAFYFYFSRPLSVPVKKFQVEAEWSANVCSFSFGADAFISTLGEPFDMDAYIRLPGVSKSFYLNADKSKVGERRGQYNLNWKILTRVTSDFGANAYTVSWVQKALYIDSFIRCFFTIDAFKNKGNSFSLNARFASRFFINSVKSTTFSATFSANANKVSATGAGNRWRTFSANSVIKVIGTSGKTRLWAELTDFRRAFDLSWSFGRQFYIDAWVGSKNGGMAGFGLDAYVQKLVPILFDDNGNRVPATGAAPKHTLKIYIGIRQPQLRNVDSYAVWYRRVAALQYFISVYEGIPLAKRTDKQKTALANDLVLLKTWMQKLREAADIPVVWTDYTSKVLWREATFTQAARVGSGSFSMGLKGSFPEIQGGEEIRVEVDGYRIFGGYVTQIEKTYFFPNIASPKTVLHGTDYNALFDRLMVYNLRKVMAMYYKNSTHAGGYESPPSFSKGTSDQEIILEVIERNMLFDLPLDFDYSSYVDAIDTPAPVTGWMLPESGSPWRAMMQSITTVTNGIFYIDPYKNLHYHDRSRVTAPFAISDGAGGISCRELVISSDVSQMKNDVTVWGTLAKTVGGEIMNWREIDDGKSAQRYWKSRVDAANKILKSLRDKGLANLTQNQQKTYDKYTELLPYYKAQLEYAMQNPGPDSTAVYGRWQNPEFRTDIHSESWVLKRARSIVARYGQPVITAKATIYEPGLIAGQVVTLKSSAYGITADLPIRTVTITFPAFQGNVNGVYYATSKYELMMGLDPETGWNIYDYLPFEGINTGYKAK